MKAELWGVPLRSVEEDPVFPDKLTESTHQGTKGSDNRLDCPKRDLRKFRINRQQTNRKQKSHREIPLGGLRFAKIEFDYL